MTTSLGRIFDPHADGPRGPDVLHRVQVPPEWFSAGATFRLSLPRVLGCAACEGGGCDACERAGAFRLRSRELAEEEVSVTLPAGATSECTLVLRIPEHGAAHAQAEVPRGHLLLRVSSGELTDASVERVDESAALAAYQAKELGFPLHQRIRVLGMLAVALSILFVLILKLARLI